MTERISPCTPANLPASEMETPPSSCPQGDSRVHPAIGPAATIAISWWFSTYMFQQQDVGPLQRVVQSLVGPDQLAAHLLSPVLPVRPLLRIRSQRPTRRVRFRSCRTAARRADERIRIRESPSRGIPVCEALGVA